MYTDISLIDNSTPPIGSVYASFFSSGVLRELAHKGHSTVATRLVRQNRLFERFPNMTVGEFYDAIFKILVREYRHEYIYKNAIAEKILLGKHSLKTASMLTEFRVDDCKADVVVLNGTSHVYEIKSEMDSFDRLDRQLAAYRKVFDFISVITTERLYETVKERISKDVGIMVLANRGYQFRKEPCREAISNRAHVDPFVIFDSLQRREYLKIIRDQFNISLAHLPNTQIYSAAKSYFANLSSVKAHNAMVEVLKHRRDVLRVADFVTNVPSSLKAASLTLRLTNEERSRFVELLCKDIKTAFA